MPLAPANGIELFYESFGSETDPPVVLIMGFGVQLLGWDEGFCRRLAGRGFRVIRFDNRDVGLSTRCGDRDGYSLDDMALDTVGLLDALGLPSAHVVGASMGGMIGQLMAIRHPSRVRSLASVMSTTGAPGVGWPRQDVFWVLMQPPPSERGAFIEHMVKVSRAIGSPAFPMDDAALRERIGVGYDRSFHPAGTARQARALMSAWDRTAALAELRLPVVVIHGDRDPLVQPDGGEATARAVPGAKLVTIPGMGHDLPAAVWPAIIDAIVENASRA